MSSFSGKIQEFPQISLDRFDGRNLASTAYFLSHAHSDHMIGLSSPQFLDHLESNSGVYLYCSQITARFLQASIRHRPLTPYVVPLQLEESTKIIIPNVAEVSHQVWVTLIPAAHCPGSVMFLFEGRGGSVLYTGDFRLSGAEVARLGTLHDEDGEVKVIDSLHIDTTFCHRDIMYFPSREESAQAIEELVEEWLAKGNSHLIHLLCPAKYGYEYIYRSLHERFSMKIHVSRWKFRMYDTVPEIQEALTLDATATWIHACDYRARNEEEANEVSGRKQLPCRCVPYGVTTTPIIRIIKPSALFYTIYQSAKAIKQINGDGTFCRVLLSMHASCSEILDVVSYLRPRKVLPNVIPINSTKEEVLKLLHEALNRSGDHYSIEYEGTHRTTLGSFKRQLDSVNSSSTWSSCRSLLDGSMFESFLSPNKKRRHSDSNMTFILPTPRVNIKGSLSLEADFAQKETPQPSTSEGISSRVTPEPVSMPVWDDPYTPSPTKLASPKANEDSPTKAEGSQTVCLNSKIENDNRNESEKVNINNSSFLECDSTSSKVAIVVTETKEREEEEDLVIEKEKSLESSQPKENDSSDIKQRRKLWYKHKYFSTPVHELDKGESLNKKATLAPRSSSLPLPKTPIEHVKSELSSSCDTDHLSTTPVCINDSNNHTESIISVTEAKNSGQDDGDSKSSRPSVIKTLPNYSVQREKCTPIVREKSQGIIKDIDTGWLSPKKIKKFSYTTRKSSDKPEVQMSSAENSKQTKFSHSKMDVEVVHLDTEYESNDENIPDIIVVKSSPEEGQSMALDLSPSAPRSSCLKTVRRKKNHVEVVTLDRRRHL